MTRRSPLLLSLVLERRAQAAPPFVPRALSAEEHGRLAAMAGNGSWDRPEYQKARALDTAEALAELGRAQAAYERIYGPMPDEQSWGGRA